MNGLKNLIPKGVFSDHNFINLKKKSQDLKKNINVFFDHIHQINNIYANYYGHFQGNLVELDSSFPNNQENNLKLFKQTISIFKGFNKQLRNLVEKQSINKKSILQLNELFINDYNVLVVQFQQNGKEYVKQQQSLMQFCSAYFKMHKQMLHSIESYKKSFMDVNIIYNKNEKIKRYNECLNLYKNLQEDLPVIHKKVSEINRIKNSLANKYQILERHLTNFSSSAVIRYIDQLKNFAESLFQMERNKLQIIKNKILQIQVVNGRFLGSTINLRYQEYILNQVKLSECEFLPCFIFYSQNLKEEAVPLFKKMVIIYYQEMTIRIEKKKFVSKKLFEYLQKYMRGIEKHLNEPIRQILLNFQKIKKKIGQTYGASWLNFYNIVSKVFQKSLQSNGMLLKQAENKIKNIQNCINDQMLLFDTFLKEFKNFLDKNVSKKIIKRYTGSLQEKVDGLLEEQVATSRDQIKSISSVLGKEILKVNQKIIKSQYSLKLELTTFLNVIKNSTQEFNSFSYQILHNQYKEGTYTKDYEFCQVQISLSVRKEMKFFEQIQFSLIKDGNKTTFEGEFNKIEGFKKIKKPKQLQTLAKEENMSISQEQVQQRPMSNSNPIQSNQKGTKQLFLGQSTSKHAQFLLTKIQIIQNEKYIKSCSCSLSDRVTLAGRMYITSHRFFFYSKFNRKNLFFGNTFIQVPKNDIKKIQKKAHSVFINNAISITTTNGELFFTSFKSRGTIFNLLKNTYQINTADIFFQEQEESQAEQHQEQINFDDDMTKETSLARQPLIMKQLQPFEYLHLLSAEFELLGLTPIKFLKIFELDQEVNINRTSYPSFTYYFKDLYEHKEINIEQWTPNPIDYLNTINIKQSTPQIFTRKHSAIVPLPPSNIPFMAKTSFAVQSQSLFLINQDKYIMESIIKSSGFPYCDAFDLRMKKTIETSQANKVKYNMELFVNFNQKIMVQSTIYNSSVENSKIIYGKYAAEVKKYLKSLEKKLMKNNKKQTPEDKIIQQIQQLRELQIQLQTLKDQKKQNLSLISQQRQRIKHGNIKLIVLAIVVLLQLYIIIS